MSNSQFQEFSEDLGEKLKLGQQSTAVNTTQVSLQRLRFFDLPTELRLMVYKLLPNRTDRTEFVKISKDGPDSSFALITCSAPTVILHTCRIIRNEASEIIDATAQPLLQATGLAGLAPRIEADCAALEALLASGGILHTVIKLYRSIALGPEKHLRVWKAVDKDQSHDVLQNSGYSPRSGTSQQGKERVIEFVRKATWALQHHQTCHPKLLPEVHLLLRKREREELCVFQEPIIRLRTMLKSIGLLYPISLLVRLHTLKNDASRRHVIDRQALDQHYIEYIASLGHDAKSHAHPQPGYQFHILAGQMYLDTVERDVYERFWNSCEWF